MRDVGSAVDGDQVAAPNRFARLNQLDGGGRGIHEHRDPLTELGDRVLGLAWGGAKDGQPLTLDDLPVRALVDHEKLTFAEHRPTLEAEEDRGRIVVADAARRGHGDSRRPLKGRQLVTASYLGAGPFDHGERGMFVDLDGA